MKYPCDWCGSCSIWLAAFEVEELDTYEKLVATCKQYECPIVGTEVPDVKEI